MINDNEAMPIGGRWKEGLSPSVDDVSVASVEEEKHKILAISFGGGGVCVCACV